MYHMQSDGNTYMVTYGSKRFLHVGTRGRRRFLKIMTAFHIFFFAPQTLFIYYVVMFYDGSGVYKTRRNLDDHWWTGFFFKSLEFIMQSV